MEFYLKINRKTITEVQFMTDGCAPTIACGSMLTKMVKNKTLKDNTVKSTKKKKEEKNEQTPKKT